MRVAFVVPWFGESIPGGAEAVVRELVRRMRWRGIAVEVITTCIREFGADWSANHYRAGVRRTSFGPVRRFGVEPRDVRRFDRINRFMMFNARGRPGVSPLDPCEERTYIDEQFRCPTLSRYLMANRDAYDVFVFMPYMFATSVCGLEAVGEKGVLIPALHDESYAYMNVYRRMAERAGCIVSQTASEHRLIGRVWGDRAAVRTRLVGMGIDTNVCGNAARFGARFGVDGPFLLYVGRRDVTKGLYRLIWNYLEYRRAGGRHALVLIGPGELPSELGRCAGVIDLGYVDSQSKYDAHAACEALVQPSEREAFSIVVLDSWLCGRPVLVEARSEVNRDHCLFGRGGLFYRNTAEFIEAVGWLGRHGERVSSMVAAGRSYVIDSYSWQGVMGRFVGVLEEVAERSGPREARREAVPC